MRIRRYRNHREEQYRTEDMVRVTSAKVGIFLCLAVAVLAILLAVTEHQLKELVTLQNDLVNERLDLLEEVTLDALTETQSYIRSEVKELDKRLVIVEEFVAGPVSYEPSPAVEYWTDVSNWDADTWADWKREGAEKGWW